MTAAGLVDRNSRLVQRGNKFQSVETTGNITALTVTITVQRQRRGQCIGPYNTMGGQDLAEQILHVHVCSYVSR